MLIQTHVVIKGEQEAELCVDLHMPALSFGPQPYFAFLYFLLHFQGQESHQLYFTGSLVSWVPVQTSNRSYSQEMKKQEERRSHVFLLFLFWKAVLCRCLRSPAIRVLARMLWWAKAVAAWAAELDLQSQQWQKCHSSSLKWQHTNGLWLALFFPVCFCSPEMGVASSS